MAEPPKAEPTGDHRAFLLDVAWRDFIVWAGKQPDCIAAFNEQTGSSFRRRPAANALEAMIDGATGKIRAETEAFVLWVTEHYWGVDQAPAKVRAAILARRQEISTTGKD
jgi:hypothetical protein